MNSFKSLLKKFDTTLKRYNLHNYKKLQEPLPEKEINNYLKSFGINNENFKALFEWKDGFDFRQGVSPRFQIFDFDALISLEYLKELKNTDAGLWSKNFIPLVLTMGGDFLLFNNQKGGDYGKLHLYSVSLLFIDEPISYYDSIAAMIQTTIKAYEQEVFKYNQDTNWLDIDFEKYHLIASKINKKSKYWFT